MRKQPKHSMPLVNCDTSRHWHVDLQLHDCWYCIRNATRAFQSQADIALIWWIRALNCSWANAARSSEKLEMWWSHAVLSEQSWLLIKPCASLMVLLEEFICYTVYNRRQKRVLRYRKNRRQCHLQHISRFLLKWKLSNSVWLQANNVWAFLHMIRWLPSHAGCHEEE